MPISFPVHIKTLQVIDGPQKRVYYPKVTKMDDVMYQHTINLKIVDEVQRLITVQSGNMPTRVVEILGTYDLKNNQRNILSLTLTNYTYHYHAAHGMTYISALNFDLEKKQLLTLQDLFMPGSNYLERLTALIKEQIERRDIPLKNNFDRIRPNQDFYLADKSIVIYFQLYEITPYAFGFPMFPISVYDLSDIIDENGPLGRLAQSN